MNIWIMSGAIPRRNLIKIFWADSQVTSEDIIEANPEEILEKNAYSIIPDRATNQGLEELL